MRYFIDTEFNENGRVIDLISIGIVAEDGREYYAVSKEFTIMDCNTWVVENVLSLLPPVKEWKWPREIAVEALEFIREGAGKPVFYGWYADYDWVVFCQIFGSMINLPKGFPMYCRDLKQMADEIQELLTGTERSIYADENGRLILPSQEGTEHDALEDARWNVKVYERLMQIKEETRVIR
jgi:hypothetical protein